MLGVWCLVPRGADIVRLVIACLLALGVVGKVHHPDVTLISLRWVLPEALAANAVYLIVIVEVVLCAWLLAGYRPDLALLLAASFFGVALCWVFYLWVSKAPVGCGCGLAKAESATSVVDVAKVLLLLISSITASKLSGGIIAKGVSHERV